VSLKNYNNWGSTIPSSDTAATTMVTKKHVHCDENVHYFKPFTIMMATALLGESGALGIPNIT